MRNPCFLWKGLVLSGVLPLFAEQRGKSTLVVTTNHPDLLDVAYNPLTGLTMAVWHEPQAHFRFAWRTVQNQRISDGIPLIESILYASGSSTGTGTTSS